MQNKKKQTLQYLLAIYAVFGLFLAYTLFANTGLEFRVDKEQSPVQVFVKNSSFHEIRNVQVFLQGQNTAIAEIKKLSPGEEKLLDAPNLTGNVVFSAKAPFHLEVQTEVELSMQVLVNVSLSAPDDMNLNATETALLELCNQGGASVTAMAQYLPNETISATPVQQSNAIAAGKCATFSFALEALKAGQTSIDFNISAASIHKTVSKTIEVKP
ncbi:MAG: hypothetical protein V1847_00135 [Candidatus Diapherotrites archaeon]